MTAKHSTPEWRMTSRHVRAAANQAHKRGEEVTCWRCGLPLPETEEGRLIFDVGHISPGGGEGTDNAAPEHRNRTGNCMGNRAHGGQMGARITNQRRTPTSFVAPAWA